MSTEDALKCVAPRLRRQKTLTVSEKVRYDAAKVAVLANGFRNNAEWQPDERGHSKHSTRQDAVRSRAYKVCRV